MAEENEKFEVRDRRIFNQEGEQVQEVPDIKESMPGDAPGLHVHQEEQPPVDFMAFIGSLGASALMYLGEKVAPDQPDDLKDLAGAKQMIDLIALLEEKTKGNLTAEEAHMMQTLLYNLRMRYVREAEKK